MTDVIDRVHGGSVDGFPEFEAIAPWEARTSDRTPRSVGPVQVFLVVVLGCCGILLLANVSHLAGWRAGLSMAVAWVQVALAFACVIRSTRSVLVTAVVASLLGAGVWLSMRGVAGVPKSVVWGGVGLAACSCLTALLLACVPMLGRRWSPSVMVLTSVVPVAIVGVTAVSLFVAPTAPVAHAATAPQSFASASAALAQKTTVPVPGENSKQFQRILAGNTSEQTELKRYVPLDRRRSGRHDPTAQPSPRRSRAVPDRRLGQGSRHDPGGRHGPRSRRPLPADRGQWVGRAVRPFEACLVDLRQHRRQRAGRGGHVRPPSRRSRQQASSGPTTTGTGTPMSV